MTNETATLNETLLEREVADPSGIVSRHLSSTYLLIITFHSVLGDAAAADSEARE